MKERHISYLVSVLIGIIAGVIGGFLIYNLFVTPGKLIFVLLFGIIASSSVILLSFILSWKFSITWEIIRTRFYCIILLLITYIYSSLFFFDLVCFIQGESFTWILWDIAGIPLKPFFFITVLPFFIKAVPAAFLCSNVLTIPAAYVATREIENLSMRIKSAFLLAISIYLASALPIISTIFY